MEIENSVKKLEWKRALGREVLYHFLALSFRRPGAASLIQVAKPERTKAIEVLSSFVGEDEGRQQISALVSELFTVVQSMSAEAAAASYTSLFTPAWSSAVRVHENDYVPYEARSEQARLEYLLELYRTFDFHQEI